MFFPPDTLDLESLGDGQEEVRFSVSFPSVAVLSQSCDMMKGREKIKNVILSRIYKFSDFEPGNYVNSSKGKETIKRGNVPYYHLLASCKINETERDFGIVDFREVYSVPISVVRNHATRLGIRVRMLEPYRSHLSQALGRYFMRVALPNDIDIKNL